LTALPYPAPQSAMIGARVAPTIVRVIASDSDIVSRSASGVANVALISKPLAQTASNPASPTSFAESALCAPVATIGPIFARRRLSSLAPSFIPNPSTGRRAD
jgi:hypothetical protein